MAGSTVIVAGALANKAWNGGEAWVRLSWAKGLEALGYRVVFVEEASGVAADEINWFSEVIAAHGLSGRAALLGSGGDSLWGLSRAEVVEVAADAALLVNISGNLHDEEVRSAVRLAAYVDIDPGFTQFWHAAGHPGSNLAGHDLFFTIGENIGTPGCPVPTGGVDWRPCRQPVVLELWPATTAVAPSLFTTVASWRNPLGTVTYAGTTFGLKVHEFRKLAELPRAVREAQFRVALDIHPADGADRELLLRGGWVIDDPADVASTDAFRTWVQSSGAELSPAQGVYVDTACGWFSDRSVRYLASGRPVIVQDTGFGRWLPTGEGVLGFRSVKEAAAAVRAVLRDPLGHQQAARRLAEDFFAHDVVLPPLLDACGTS